MRFKKFKHINDYKKFVSTLNQRRVTQIIHDFKLSEYDILILYTIAIYQTFKVKYLKCNSFIFPLKIKISPLRQKPWKHFKNLLTILHANAFDIFQYFEFHFKRHSKKNTSNLAYYFIYSEHNINSYLNYINNMQQVGITNLKSNLDHDEYLVKKLIASRKCTELEFWKQIWVYDFWKRLSKEYLLNHKIYKKIYKECKLYELGLPKPH